MCMGSSSRPAAPPPPPPPPAPPPTATSPAAKKARDDERQRVRAMAGRKSTIRAGALGIQEEANRQLKTLLGG